MHTRSFACISFLLGSSLLAEAYQAQNASLPHLEKHGAATQLILDGKPFLILGAELHNSSSSNLDYMKPIWPRLAEIPLNTVLTPLSWELVEPAEGKFDFTLLDGLLAQAREHNLHIVFLWLASWKNGMSSYAPVWVKRDTHRFPRVIENGNQVDILSTFGQTTRDADARAFAAVMHHLRQVDGREHTVLMMQVENEVGVLGDTRDHSQIANQAFESAVPNELMRYLTSHRNALYPDLLELWEASGGKSSGTWEQVFGASSRTDELFMAWHYALYVQAVAATGKAAYQLPMYVNTWLAGEDTIPGDYPSGGPQPRVVDVWKAAGSAIDIYSPDIYQPNFAAWCARYHRAGNPLFIPETSVPAGAANAFFAFGEGAALGFSPFGIDSWNDTKNELGKSYQAIAQIAPTMLEHQADGSVHGFVLDKGHPSVEFVIDGYSVQVTLDQVFGMHAEKGFGLIIAVSPNEFLGVGQGFRVIFKTRSESGPHVGFASIDEGSFEDGKWVAGRRLNGDETDQGQYWRFDQRQIHLEKAVIYQFQ